LLLNLAGNWVRDHVPVHGLKTAEDNLGRLHSQSDVWGDVQNTLDNGKHYTPLPLNSAVETNEPQVPAHLLANSLHSTICFWSVCECHMPLHARKFTEHIKQMVVVL
jgi:hypothetical protein